MTKLLHLTCLLLLAGSAALAQAKPGEPGYVPPEVREDPLTNQVGETMHVFLEETKAPIRVTKLWAVSLKDIQGYLLAECSPDEQQRGKELTSWGAGFGAGGSRQGSALLVHVIRCAGPEQAQELLKLLRKDANAKLERVNAKLAEHGLKFPPIADTTLEEGVTGFAFDARPDLGTKVAANRSAKLGYTCGRVLVYCEAMDNYGSESLTVLGKRLLAKIQADERAKQEQK